MSLHPSGKHTLPLGGSRMVHAVYSSNLGYLVVGTPAPERVLRFDHDTTACFPGRQTSVRLNPVIRDMTKMRYRPIMSNSSTPPCKCEGCSSISVLPDLPCRDCSTCLELRGRYLRSAHHVCSCARFWYFTYPFGHVCCPLAA